MMGRVLIGKYAIGRKLSEGGFGSVYEAEHLTLQGKVAVKVLERARGISPESLERFRREAVALSQLTHPCAVRVFDRGETEDGRLWIAMELLHGETLEARLREGGEMSPGEVVDLLTPVCELLQEAHEKGIFHRDLKPENIMLLHVAGGKVLPKVFDFGIAGLAHDDALTGPDLVSGTPRYMAPEQWEGLRYADARSDIYSLGVIAYRCLSGRFPLEAEGALAWMNKHRFEEPLDLRAAMEGRPLPERMRRAVMTALAKNPAERPASAWDFARELAGGGGDAPEEIRPRGEAIEDRGGGPSDPTIRAGAASVGLRAGARVARLLVSLGIAAGILAGVAALARVHLQSPSPAPACDPLPGSYMPLRVGAWWRYRVINPATGQPDPVDKTITLDRHGEIGGLKPGIVAFRLFREDTNGVAHRWLRAHEGAVVWEHDEWFDRDGKLTRSTFYRSSRLRVDERCERRTKGARWTETYDAIHVDPVTGREKVVANAEDWVVEATDEVVTVPAGSFSCLRIRRRNPKSNTDSTYWFAPGVGKVKEESPPLEFEELVAYSIP
jgi:serine/threonine-protein kinase